MKPDKSYIKKIAQWYKFGSNEDFLSRHPELETFDMPKTFYFKFYSDRHEIHWAIIKDSEECTVVYFINNRGRVFDKLEFKSVKIARRRLRKNGFDFSTNRYCPFTPPEPIYIQLCEGKKSAPYSKGCLWKKTQRNIRYQDKIEKAIIKQIIEFYERRHALPKDEVKFTSKLSILSIIMFILKLILFLIFLVFIILNWWY